MINKLPKIELHCHLDGSVRVDTIIDIAKKECIKLDSYKKDDVERKAQVPNDCTSLNEYLKRFDLPNKVMQSSENIKRITFELLEDAQKENIKYIEVRFAPLLHINNGLTVEEVENILKSLKFELSLIAFTSSNSFTISSTILPISNFFLVSFRVFLSFLDRNNNFSTSSFMEAASFFMASTDSANTSLSFAPQRSSILIYP